MPATRDGKLWRSQFYYKDWQGVRRKKNKRGFKTKGEADEWERNFLQQQQKNLDISFENFVEIYFADMENRLRESTIINKRYLIEGKAWVNNHAHIIKSHYGEVGNKYILHYLNVFNFHGYVNGTTRLKLTQASMRTIPVPLPPLAEQKRIVEQIESLFAKLDEAKEKALSVVESFESRKKAILNNAFNGLYSTDWREKHHCTLADWKDRKINEICIPRAGFAFNSKKFTESGIQIIRMGNLYAGKLNLSRSPVFYDISDVDDNIIKRSMVHDGDILLTLTGTKYKRDYEYAVCIEGEHELLVNQRILCLSPTEKIDKEYLLYYLRSEIFRDIFLAMKRVELIKGMLAQNLLRILKLNCHQLKNKKRFQKF